MRREDKVFRFVIAECARISGESVEGVGIENHGEIEFLDDSAHKFLRGVVSTEAGAHGEDSLAANEFVEMFVLEAAKRNGAGFGGDERFSHHFRSVSGDDGKARLRNGGGDESGAGAQRGSASHDGGARFSE